jgi:hypothetical protein
MSDYLGLLHAGLGGGVVGGFIVLLKGFILFRKKRFIEKIPLSKIRSLAMGLVKVHGEVTRGGKGFLKSPFFLKDCVYYMYVIERLMADRHPERWKTLKTESETLPFILRDETGSVLVDPAEAEINTTKGFEWLLDREHMPPVQVREFLALHGIEYKDPLGLEYKMRYREYFIEPGDKLYILGTAGDNPFLEEESVQSDVEDVVIQRGGRKKPYIISDSTEKGFLDKLGREFRIQVIGGALTSLVCLMMLLYLFFT